jgi:ribosomal protein L16 Arg81 hydroxylase
MSTATLHKSAFTKVKEVTWEDTLNRLDQEFNQRSHTFITDGVAPPTFVTHTDFYPGSVQSAFDEVSSVFPVTDLHIYISVAGNSKTFGRHKDDMNVLIVPAIGDIIYRMDDGEYRMSPGDALYIPSGVYHCPLVLGPRVTLSFGMP